MSGGEKAIEWFYKNQLQVDAEWSVRTKRGFTWWPYQHAQTIETTGEVKGLSLTATAEPVLPHG